MAQVVFRVNRIVIGAMASKEKSLEWSESTKQPPKKK